MKKLITITQTIALILISAAFLQAKVSPEVVASNVDRQTAKHLPVYLNDRVKTMCEEWPGCDEWVKYHAAKNACFHVADAEVERWIDKWEGKKAIWLTYFYINTIENGKAKAYKFVQMYENGYYGYGAPQPIKKFPGHPVVEKPSQHAKWIPIVKADRVSPLMSGQIYIDIEFPGLDGWLKQNEVVPHEAVVEQRIYGKDIDGNPLWARTLYIEKLSLSGKGPYYKLSTYQMEDGTCMIKPAQKIKVFPNLPPHL